MRAQARMDRTLRYCEVVDDTNIVDMRVGDMIVEVVGKNE